MEASDIRTILDTIELNQVGWEGDEDIMTFNGTPIGATLSGHRETDRWWPDLKCHIAQYLADKLPCKTKSNNSPPSGKTSSADG